MNELDKAIEKGRKRYYKIAPLATCPKCKTGRAHQATIDKRGCCYKCSPRKSSSWYAQEQERRKFAEKQDD